MKYRISQIRTDIGVPISDIPLKLASKAGIRPEDIALFFDKEGPVLELHFTTKWI